MILVGKPRSGTAGFEFTAGHGAPGVARLPTAAEFPFAAGFAGLCAGCVRGAARRLGTRVPRTAPQGPRRPPASAAAGSAPPRPGAGRRRQRALYGRRGPPWAGRCNCRRARCSDSISRSSSIFCRSASSSVSSTSSISSSARFNSSMTPFTCSMAWLTPVPWGAGSDSGLCAGSISTARAGDTAGAAGSAGGSSPRGEPGLRLRERRRPPRRDRRRGCAGIAVSDCSETAFGSSSGTMPPTCPAEAKLQWNYSAGQRPDQSSATGTI
jgi:hypothetical protein